MVTDVETLIRRATGAGGLCEEGVLQRLWSGYGSIDIDALESGWRALYPVAWTDFHRFIKGWSPGHWKIHSYSERLAREVVAELKMEDKCN